MLETDLNSRPQRHPVINIIVILVVVTLGFVLGPFVGYFLILPFYPGTGEELIEALQDFRNHPEIKIYYYFLQAFGTFIGLILIPILYLSGKARSVRDFFENKNVGWIPLIVTACVVITYIPVNSVFAEWNAEFSFPDFAPDFLKKAESWAREKEELGEAMTTFFTKFESGWQLVVAVVVIAVLPSIGEELVFRGLLQNEMYKAVKSPHTAIWISAILFSAFHMQFFGFVPRMLLGALFGYLYYWSGNLTLAIIGHFVNNGLLVIALYFYQQGAFDFDLESKEAAPASVVVVSTLLTLGLLYYLYKYFENRKPRIA
jgi:uncharacterized protein